MTETLKAITIRQKKLVKGKNQGKKQRSYYLEFEFENKRKFSTVQFLFYNSLSHHITDPQMTEIKKEMLRPVVKTPRSFSN